MSFDLEDAEKRADFVCDMNGACLSIGAIERALSRFRVLPEHHRSVEGVRLVGPCQQLVPWNLAFAGIEVDETLDIDRIRDMHGLPFVVRDDLPADVLLVEGPSGHVVFKRLSTCGL